MTAQRKAALIVAILTVGGAFAYFNLWFETATGPEVEVEAVERRGLEALVSASGKIEPKLSVDISASTMGRVTRLAFSEGDRVESGQFLLEIDPEVLRAAVDRGEAGLQASRSTQQQAEVSVESARVNLQLARDNLERQENLWELRLISRETYEIADSEVTLRETELKSREVEVATQAQRIRQPGASLTYGAVSNDAFQVGRFRVVALTLRPQVPPHWSHDVCEESDEANDYPYKVKEAKGRWAKSHVAPTQRSICCCPSIKLTLRSPLSSRTC